MYSAYEDEYSTTMVPTARELLVLPHGLEADRVEVWRFSLLITYHTGYWYGRYREGRLYFACFFWGERHTIPRTQAIFLDC